MTRREARILARKFVVDLLRSHDTPDWATERGIGMENDGSGDAFHTELRAIAARVEKTIRLERE